MIFNTNFKFPSALKPLVVSIYLISALASFASLNTHAQGAPETAEVLDLILQNQQGGTVASGGGSTMGDDSGYKSFVQNEYNKVTQQLQELSIDEKQDNYFKDLSDKRMELATKLCIKDKRACFLIEEYRDFDFVQPNTFEEVELYGLDIFSGYSNDFSFYDSLPLSGEYILRVGDVVNVLLFGSLEFDGSLTIDRTGAVTIEAIGKVQLAGLTYDAAVSKVNNIVADQFFGTQVSISMDKIRAMQVFVLGNVQIPGSFTLNTFGTALNALISSGGIRENSSLRSIEVIRNKSKIAEIDLYDLLINGNLDLVDLNLKDGDSVIVKGLKNSAALIGEVNRPALYEFIDGETLDDLLAFGLGVTPRSDLNNISVTRILVSGKTTVLNPKNLSSFKLRSGDRVQVNSSVGEQINYIRLTGAIRNSGDFSLTGDTQFLGEFINLQRDLVETTYTGFAILKRYNTRSKSHDLRSIDLISQNNIDKLKLYSGDQLFVLSKNDISFLQSNTLKKYITGLADGNNKSAVSTFDAAILPDTLKNNILQSKNNIQELNPKLECLKSLDSLNKRPLIDFLSSKFEIFNTSKDLNCTPLFNQYSELLPLATVSSVPVLGNVRFPGLYPAAKTLSALDLFYLAGSSLYASSESELDFELGTKESKFQQYGIQDLQSIANITYLKSKLPLETMFEGYVTLVGEFKNPGTYSISGREKLSSLYQRSGGVSSNAYPVAGILTRQSVLSLESKALTRAKAELTDILSSAVTSGYLKQNSTDLVGLISLMTNLSNISPIGRLVTQLDPNILKSNPSMDVYLEPGDVIYMPPIQNVVTVVGQVLNPVTVPYNSSYDFQDYLNLAGGIKGDADKRKIYAILPNGTSLRDTSGLFRLASLQRNDLLPGSTIIVPRKARPLDSLALVETISPIVASLSVTAASIAAISNNN